MGNVPVLIRLALANRVQIRVITASAMTPTENTASERIGLHTWGCRPANRFCHDQNVKIGDRVAGSYARLVAHNIDRALAREM